MKGDDVKQTVLSYQNKEEQILESGQINKQYNSASIHKRYKRKKWVFLAIWMVVVIILYTISRPQMVLGKVFAEMWSTTGEQEQELRVLIWYLLIAVMGYLVIEFVLQLRKQTEFKQQDVKYTFCKYLYILGFVLAGVLMGIYCLLLG